MKTVLRLFVWFSIILPIRAAEDAQQLARKFKEQYEGRNYSAALSTGEKVLAIVEKNVGPDQIGVGKICFAIAEVHLALNQYKEADRYFRRALKILDAKQGRDNPETVKVRIDFGTLQHRMGRPSEAEAVYREAIASLEKTGDNKALAGALNNLAVLVDNHEKSIALLERALKIYQQKLGADESEALTTMSNLANQYLEIGNYPKARTLLEDTLAKAEKKLGPEHRQVSDCLNNLAIVYKYTDDLAHAETLFSRSLRIREKILRPNDPLIGQSVRNLATVYEALGDRARAKELFDRALAIYEKSLGPEHPETADVLITVGAFYSDGKDFAKAEALLERALRASEKAYGAEHSQTTHALMSLAGHYKDRGEPEKALPLYERALPLREKAFGSDSVPVAAALNDTAAVCKDLQQDEKAVALYTRALEILEKRVGPLHPTLQKTLSNCAFAQIDAGHPDEAAALAAKASVAGRKLLENILSFTSEAQRLEFQRTTHPYCLLGTLGNVAPLADTVTRTKGAVLDSLIEDRLLADASTDPKIREKIERAQVLKRQLSQAEMDTPARTGKGAPSSGNGAIAAELERLEASIAREVAGVGRARRAAGVKVADVQAALPNGSVLIELIRYHHYLGRNSNDTRYGALIIGSKNPVRWVSLGKARDIDKQIEELQQSIQTAHDDSALRTKLRGAYDVLWAPIAAALPTATNTAIISPDGQLSFVSYATLLAADDRYLAESLAIRYVSAGRDLLQQIPSGNDRTIQVFANPVFDRQDRPTEKKLIATRDIERRDTGAIQLPPLPGTESEARQIQALTGSWKYQATLGGAATEAALRAVKAPKVLHLATHGFFLPESEPDQTASNGSGKAGARLQNPMHRSGIALAGAQQTLNAWRNGKAPPASDDGIVTAEEVAELDLRGTWLVTLSACDTGLGEARTGEGVLGLRRGFIQAGVRNLLMTLWPISDDTTVQIMLDFYRRALSTEDAPQSLAEVQRDWLVKLRKQNSLCEAVRLAGPFIISSQGRR